MVLAMLVLYHITTWHHNPEDHDLNLRRLCGQTFNKLVRLSMQVYIYGIQTKLQQP